MIAECKGLVTVHAENDDIIETARQRLLSEGKTAIKYFPEYKPDESEAKAVEHCIRIAKETNCKLLIRHISSEAAVNSILEAQKQGYPIYAETCPHYLAFTREVYGREDGQDFIVHPPIRGEKDRQAIWNAIRNGIIITIATDDCGFFRAQKRISNTFYGVPGGLPGLETRLLVLFGLGVETGKITLSRLAQMTSETPAKLYGIYPKKGTLQIGSDADMVILDTSVRTVITSKKLHEQSDYTIYEGFTVNAAVEKTIAHGEVILDGNRFLGKETDGRLLYRGLPIE